MLMRERDIIENAKRDLWALASLVGVIYKLEDQNEVDAVCPYLERQIEQVSDMLYDLVESTTVDI